MSVCGSDAHMSQTDIRGRCLIRKLGFPMKTLLATSAFFFLLSSATLPGFSAAGIPPAPRPFTPKDDVGLALFEYAGRAVRGGVIKYSPDGRYLAVVTERGRLDLNAPEDTIWVFRLED